MSNDYIETEIKWYIRTDKELTQEHYNYLRDNPDFLEDIEDQMEYEDIYGFGNRRGRTTESKKKSKSVKIHDGVWWALLTVPALLQMFF